MIEKTRWWPCDREEEEEEEEEEEGEGEGEEEEESKTREKGAFRFRCVVRYVWLAWTTACVCRPCVCVCVCVCINPDSPPDTGERLQSSTETLYICLHGRARTHRDRVNGALCVEVVTCQIWQEARVCVCVCMCVCECTLPFKSLRSLRNVLMFQSKAVFINEDNIKWIINTLYIVNVYRWLFSGVHEVSTEVCRGQSPVF